MNRLSKNHHFNVDVQKRRSFFAKCIVSESLKDLISKLGKTNNNVKEYEFKLKNITFIENHARPCTILGDLSQYNLKMGSYV